LPFGSKQHLDEYRKVQFREKTAGAPSAVSSDRCGWTSLLRWRQPLAIGDLPRCLKGRLYEGGNHGGFDIHR